MGTSVNRLEVSEASALATLGGYAAVNAPSRSGTFLLVC